jgi:hypothetical protein
MSRNNLTITEKQKDDEKIEFSPAFERFLQKLDENNMKISFSKNCCSGLVEKCECWRCRNDRGEEVNEQTEALAKIISDGARKRLEESTKRIIEKHK